MSKLISGKDALIALANGESVEFNHSSQGWVNCLGLNVEQLLGGMFSLRLKPRTITINGIEVPAPFEPKEGDKCFIVDTEQDGCFYEFTYKVGYESLEKYIRLGAWKTEDEIKQVVAALRGLFRCT